MGSTVGGLLSFWLKGLGNSLAVERNKKLMRTLRYERRLRRRKVTLAIVLLIMEVIGVALFFSVIHRRWPYDDQSLIRAGDILPMILLVSVPPAIAVGFLTPTRRRR